MGLGYNVKTANNPTEYWALLIFTFYTFNDNNIALVFDNLYNVLLDTPWWSSDHIKILKDEEATKWNIIQGLKWLDSLVGEPTKSEEGVMEVSEEVWKSPFRTSDEIS